MRPGRTTTTTTSGAVLVALVLVSAACASSTDSGASRGTVTVAAAASLYDVFTTLGAGFEESHPGVHVEFTFGSSGVLEVQLAHGAPADVFASADTEVMDRARHDGVLATEPVIFARNRLEIVTRPGNPLGIDGLDDLRRADVVALCALEAPCGAKAEVALQRAGVELATSQITRAQDVKATLRQVTAGDADAAIVYVTDARTVGDRATAVPIPAAANVSNDYPIAVVKGTGQAALSQAWIDYVAGPAGRVRLRRAGFDVPS